MIATRLKVPTLALRVSRYPREVQARSVNATVVAGSRSPSGPGRVDGETFELGDLLQQGVGLAAGHHLRGLCSGCAGRRCCQVGSTGVARSGVRSHGGADSAPPWKRAASCPGRTETTHRRMRYEAEHHGLVMRTAPTFSAPYDQLVSKPCQGSCQSRDVSNFFRWSRDNCVSRRVTTRRRLGSERPRHRWAPRPRRRGERQTGRPEAHSHGSGERRPERRGHLRYRRCK